MWLAPACMCLFGVYGCNSQSSSGNGDGSIEIMDVKFVEATKSGTVVIQADEEPNAWPEVLIEGRVSRVDGTGCLVLERNDDPELPIVGIVWPYGTSVGGSGEDLKIKLTNGEDLRIGDYIEAGGTTLSRSIVTENLGRMPTCSSEVFVAFSPESVSVNQVPGD